MHQTLLVEYRRMIRHQRMNQEAVVLADWMIDNKCTIMQLEKEFLIPHSTVHRRLTITLKDVDYDKYKQCRSIMMNNKNNRVSRAVAARQENRERRKSL